MTMLMKSPPPKREALRRSRSNRLLQAQANPPPSEESRLSRRKHKSMEKAPSTRGLARVSSARWQASRSSSRALNIDNEEEITVDMESEDHHQPQRRRGLPRRTASLDDTEEPRSSSNKRRPLQRNKSCDGTTVPHQRILNRRNVTNVAVLERATSMRRFGSNRRLMMDQRARSERRLEAADNTKTPPSRQRRLEASDRTSSRRQLSLDNSSDDAARSSRRRGPPSRSGSGMDDSSNRRRLAARSKRGGSGNMNGMRRRKPRSNERRDSARDLSLMIMKDQSTNSQQEDSSQNNVTVPGKGLDDGNRRRKEPTLSKMSINELRNRLVGAKEDEEGGGADCEQECDENNHDSMGSHNDSFQANWDVGTDAGPLATDLNHNEAY